MVASMKTAAALVIGNEILSGRTQDANLVYIGKRLSELGIDLAEARVIPDVEAVVIKHINELRSAHDYVFTTGGIGPTHDDITTQCIAKAFAVAVNRHPGAVACLQEYYGEGVITETNLKMADIPEGAELVANLVSGAPGYRIENVYVFAGVPRIMQAMFDGISHSLVGGAAIESCSVSTDLRESQLANGLEVLQGDYPSITVGSYPYYRQGQFGTSVVLRGTDTDVLYEAQGRLKGLVDGLAGRLLDDP